MNSTKGDSLRSFCLSVPTTGTDTKINPTTETDKSSLLLITPGLLLQAGRTRRSHAEKEGQVTPQGSVGRTTPAVSASDRRKSLKLVGREKRDVCWKSELKLPDLF